MTGDARTLAVYDARAAEYAELTGTTHPDSHLAGFIAALPKGGRVLDLGCGPGAASAHMAGAGLDPDPVDASPGMVAVAREKFGLPARVATFDEVGGTGLYDGIWANFSLLHAPRADLPRHLAALARALRPGGLFHIGMKTGTGEKRDGIDRMYTYVTADELAGLLTDVGIRLTLTDIGEDLGLDGVMAPWVVMQGVRDA